MREFMEQLEEDLFDFFPRLGIDKPDDCEIRITITVGDAENNKTRDLDPGTTIGDDPIRPSRPGMPRPVKPGDGKPHKPVDPGKPDETIPHRCENGVCGIKLPDDDEPALGFEFADALNAALNSFAREHGLVSEDDFCKSCGVPGWFVRAIDDGTIAEELRRHCVRY